MLGPIEWDPVKSASNLRKHGVSFEEAAGLLASDADYLEIYDEQHSDDEDRFIAIGPIVRAVIVVVFTEREDGMVRIVSARKAFKSGRRHFDGVTGCDAAVEVDGAALVGRMVPPDPPMLKGTSRSLSGG